MKDNAYRQDDGSLFQEACGAIYRRICETFSALQSTSGSIRDVENSFQIDA